MIVLGIDPGPTQSGVVRLVDGEVQDAATMPNAEVRQEIARIGVRNLHLVAIEQVRSYGMAVGAEVFDTCVETGRFVECATASADKVVLIPRMDVKMHLCNSPRAKDANIRQALLDRLGAQGTKKAPGPTYGVSGHAWAALAIAVTAWDREIAKAAA